MIKTILLVDDDLDDQLLFEEALSEADNSILYLSAFDGSDALAKLQSGEIPIPDLLFMDVNMPKMNGIDCLKELQKCEKLKRIPIIMYSTSSYYKKECFESGAAEYMEKPDDFRQLHASLKTILSQGLPLVKNSIH